MKQHGSSSPDDVGVPGESEVARAPGNLSRRQMLAFSGVAGASLAVRSSVVAGKEAAREHPKPDLKTRLTREYGVRFPFVGAGMGFVSMPPLVAAVSNAGGIGVLGNAIEPAAGTQVLIQAIRSATPNLFGVDFIVDTSAFGPTVTDAHIDVCVSERVGLVVFHMNVPPQEWVDRLHGAGARVWMQAGSVSQAVEAAGIGTRSGWRLGWHQTRGFHGSLRSPGIQATHRQRHGSRHRHNDHVWSGISRSALSCAA